MFEAFPEGVGGDRNAAGLAELDVDHDVAEDVADDRDVAFAGGRAAFAAE